MLLVQTVRACRDFSDIHGEVLKGRTVGGIDDRQREQVVVAGGDGRGGAMPAAPSTRKRTPRSASAPS